jgi:hypothetical protein
MKVVVAPSIDRGPPVAFISKNNNVYLPNYSDADKPVQLKDRSSTMETGYVSTGHGFSWGEMMQSNTMFRPLFKGDVITIEL